ncbi:unnamed protein product [Paramecium primaurelia]|uniref:Uncharacterized protein n=1 Tax=Paramecium primaurelia TaxID=5886 RepID=A0A8S1QYH3_PARPR|nr:unnamed protein product [Paramecium primaurelia]
MQGLKYHQETSPIVIYLQEDGVAEFLEAILTQRH